MRFHATALLPLLPSLVSAWNPPSIDGYSLVWSDAFPGDQSTLPDESKWNIVNADLGVNNELQFYRRSTRNVQLSGGNTVQLVPWRDSSVRGGWSSARLESKYTFRPAPGKRTLIQAEIRLGGNAQWQKQGIWPAFWLLGDIIRTGGAAGRWPGCGELDIMENVNGANTGHGTVHCHISQGGICNEPLGRGSSHALPSPGTFNRWRLIWDRTTGDWWHETITWYFNGVQFHQIKGSDIGDWNVWSRLAYEPQFILLNVAVGGNWVCQPRFLSCVMEFRC